MVLDAKIIEIFGEVPPGLDLQEQTTSRDNAVVIAMTAIATVAIAGRIWARRIQGTGFYIDDWLIFLALALLAIIAALAIMAGEVNSGRHVWAMSVQDLEKVVRDLYGYIFIYAGAISTIKLSFVLYFVRVFHVGRRITVLKCRNMLDASLTLGLFLAVVFLLVIWAFMLGICTPIPYFWDGYTDQRPGHCGDKALLLEVSGIVNLCIDAIILSIPVRPVLKLQVPLADRLMIIAIFMIGGLVCVASAIRIHYLVEFREKIDITWSMGSVFIWSTIEPALGIVSSCLISLRPVIQKICAALFGADPDACKAQKTPADSRGFSLSDGPYDGTRRKTLRKTDDDEMALVTIDREVGDLATPKNGVIRVTKETEVQHEMAPSFTDSEQTITKGWQDHH